MACNKKKHRTQEDTQENIDYLISKNYIPNERYDIYFCDECGAWHFGRGVHLDVTWKPKKH